MKAEFVSMDGVWTIQNRMTSDQPYIITAVHRVEQQRSCV